MSVRCACLCSYRLNAVACDYFFLRSFSFHLIIFNDVSVCGVDRSVCCVTQTTTKTSKSIKEEEKVEENRRDKIKTNKYVYTELLFANPYTICFFAHSQLHFFLLANFSVCVFFLIFSFSLKIN